MSLDAEIAGLLGEEFEPNEPPRLDAMPDWTEAVQPVSVTWLMGAFRMDRLTVKKRLAALAPVRMGRGNSPEYDFRQAASYLVEPRINLMDYFGSLKPSNLPTWMQAQWWDAQLKRQTFEERAGHLWRTEKVLGVLGEVFLNIKSTIQLWVDTLAENVEVTDEQRIRLTQMADALQNEIHAALVEQAKGKRTEASISEVDEMIDDAGLMS